MLFPLFTNPPAVADECATNAMISCVLSYTHGLESCQIEVETVDGSVMLTGTAPSQDAARLAMSIAADFTTKPVLSGLKVGGEAEFA